MRSIYSYSVVTLLYALLYVYTMVDLWMDGWMDEWRAEQSEVVAAREFAEVRIY